MDIFGVHLWAVSDKKARKQLSKLFIDDYVDETKALELLDVRIEALVTMIEEGKMRLAMVSPGNFFYQLSDIIKNSKMKIRRLVDKVQDGLKTGSLELHQFEESVGQ